MDQHWTIDQTVTPPRVIGYFRPKDGPRVKRLLGLSWMVKENGAWKAKPGSRPPGERLRGGIVYEYLTPRMATEALAAVVAAHVPAGRDAASTPTVTVAKMLDRYLEDRSSPDAGLKPATIAGYEDQVVKLKRCWSLVHHPVAEISPQDIDDLLKGLMASQRVAKTTAEALRRQGETLEVDPDGTPYRLWPASRKTKTNYKAMLSSVFALAVAQKLIDANPVDRARFKSPTARERRADVKPGDFYTPREVAELIAAAPDAQVAAMIGLGCYAGLRLGEYRAVRPIDLMLAQQNIAVVQAYSRSVLGLPKSNITRDVPLAGQLVPLLKPLLDDPRLDVRKPLLRSRSGGVLTEREANEWFQEALQRSGLKQRKDLQLRRARHSFGTAAASRGVNMRELQAYMGHASVSTTERYVRYAPKKQAAADLTDAFESDLLE